MTALFRALGYKNAQTLLLRRGPRLRVAPCPFGDFCTLAKCKYGTIKCKTGTRRNIVELAEEGDWIAGTGGVDLGKSAGHGKLIYALRVDEKITLREYCEGNQGNRIDAGFDIPVKDRFALISYHYFYFGRNAIDISDIPQAHLDHPFEKTGPGIAATSARSLLRSSPGG